MHHFTVADFWAQQAFAYIETYSFNRGPKSAELLASLQAEITQTKLAQQQARHMDQAKLAHKLRQLEEALRGGEYNIMLPEPTDTPAFNTRRIATLPQDSAEIQQLDALLKQAGEQEVFWMCPPIYRDALAFYTAEGRRIAVLNICFECSLMTTGVKIVEANFATYDALRELLLELGHPIETPGS